jgi:hypothetical protein
MWVSLTMPRMFEVCEKAPEGCGESIGCERKTYLGDELHARRLELLSKRVRSGFELRVASKSARKA